jgi:3-deoxy-D-manno-octulosonic-acid transferase
VSTSTSSGSKALLDHYDDEILHSYFPFDLGLIINRYIQRINPVICILLETEIWPNLIHTLKQKNIPTLLINARLSERSLERYQKFAPKLVRDTLNNLSLIATQNKNSKERFIRLGAFQDKVINIGNIKFDQNPLADKDISLALGKILAGRKVVTFASTHPDEEQKIINSYSNIQDQIDALLVIIPRHPERFNEVYKIAEKANLNIMRRSSNKAAKKAQILLGDSMGEMMSYFELSDVVFMGGSLNNTGGHNMLEPAALSKPIIFGPNVFNFSEISSDLLKQKASIQVQNSDELFTQIIQLLGNEKQQKILSKNANKYFKSNQGAVDKLIKLITKAI